MQSLPATDNPLRLPHPDGYSIAYHRRPGKSPGVLFCGGFKSDMTGTKALALDNWARAAGRAYTRFDYFAHGQTGGDCARGTIGRWASDAILVLDRVAVGPQVIVGSSMGGWIMLLVALNRPARAAGLVGIAAAVDFTEELMWRRFDTATRERIERDGVWHAPSAYAADPYPITRELIVEGRRHLLLGQPIPIACPVRLLHGMRDADVPWQHSLKLIDALAGRDVRLTLVKEGDHRLSNPSDIDLLTQTVDLLCRQAEGQ